MWAARLQEFGPPVVLVALLSAVPYAVVYFKNLWELAHYQFFPLLLAAVGYLAFTRWGGRYRGGRVFACFRALLLAGGVAGVFFATLFASPWMGYFGFAFGLAAWLAHHRDAETGRSLVYLALPVLLIWQPPYNTIVTADTILIQNLQSLSAKLSSQWLDILGYLHHQPGTVLEFAGKSFGVAEACSGIQSFFAVLCFAALLTVFHRRNLLHAALLMGTSPFWALLMNTIRITAIPIAYSMFGVDLSHGFLHDLLGYCTMGLAVVLLLSTDELLLQLGRVVGVARFNQLFSRWEPRESVERAPRRVSPLWLSLASLPFVAFFCIQAYDVSESWGRQRDVIDFFRDEIPIEVSHRDAPQELLGWQQFNYERHVRERGNDDLGQQSDLWYYNAPFGEVSVSLDQMFPAWHELTRCYRNAGWTPGKRRVFDQADGFEWPFVSVEMTRGNEHGYLLFCLINRSSRPMQPPDDYTYWTILEERLRGRLTPAVRGALFGIASYQIQIFAETLQPLQPDQQEEMQSRFLIAREQLWRAASERL